MPSGESLDPFTQVYDALWRLADASEPLRALVRDGNMIRYDGPARAPDKRSSQDADMPELTLRTVGAGPVNLHCTSSSSAITRNFSWEIRTGDMRVHYRLYPVEWALACAMTTWKTVLGSLTWEGYNFVKLCELTSGNEQPTQPRSGRRAGKSIRGWKSAWSCSVLMHFQTRAMLDFNLGGS